MNVCVCVCTMATCAGLCSHAEHAMQESTTRTKCSESSPHGKHGLQQIWRPIKMDHFMFHADAEMQTKTNAPHEVKIDSEIQTWVAFHRVTLWCCLWRRMRW